MAKKVIKEIIIVLLLCLAIILVLGVLLYEYVPSNKMIPDKVSYTTPQAVQEELSKSEDVEDDQIILTYSVDSTDLDNYERIHTYVPGKPNPFSSYDTATNSSENTEQNSNSDINSSENSHSNISTNENSSTETNTENSNETNNDTNSSEGSAYFPETGTK